MVQFDYLCLCPEWVSIGRMKNVFFSPLVSCLVQINLLPPNECCKWSSIYTINKWSLFRACDECEPIDHRAETMYDQYLDQNRIQSTDENLSMPMKRGKHKNGNETNEKKKLIIIDWLAIKMSRFVECSKTFRAAQHKSHTNYITVPLFWLSGPDTKQFFPHFFSVVLFVH